MWQAKRKLPVTTFLVVVLGVTGMFLEFGVQPFFGSEHTQDVPMPIYTWHFFLCAVVAFSAIVGYLWDLHEKSNEKFGHLNTAFETLRNAGNERFDDLNLTLRALGEAKETLQNMGLASQLIQHEYSHLLTLAKDSSLVCNTWAVFSRGAHDGLVLSDSDIAKRTDIINQTVTHAGKWVDIFSEKADDRLDGEVQKLRESSLHKYVPLVLNTSHPVVNFTLFKKNDHAEVWFGFGLFAGYDGPVFRSCDKDLCEYFEKYFSVLRSESHPWENAGREDMQGSWLSVAYLDERIQDIAVVWVELAETHLRVRGNVYSLIDSAFLLRRTFWSDFVSFGVNGDMATLKFIFDDNNFATRALTKGGGEYLFSTSNLDYFEGSIFSEQKETKKIYGGRLKGKNKRIAQAPAAEQRALLDILCQEGCIKATPPAEGEKAFQPSYFSHA